MTDPVEIMARAILNREWRASSKEYRDQLFALNKELYLERERVRIEALEASGWRLVHPDQVTEEMRVAADDQRIKDYIIGAYEVAAAIRAAPTYGASND